MAEDPGEKFELGDIILAVDVVEVDGVADEVETGAAETFLVDGVVEERRIGWFAGDLMVGGEFGDIGDADDSVVGGQIAGFAEMEGEVAGDNDGFLAVGKFVVEVTTEIVIFSMIDGSGAHRQMVLCF